MIKNFNTTGSGSTAAPSNTGSSNTLVIILVIGVIAYLGYNYMIKPSIEENKKNT